MNYTKEELQAYVNKSIGGGYLPAPEPPADDVSLIGELGKGFLSGGTGELSDWLGPEGLAPNPASYWPYHAGYAVGALMPYSVGNQLYLRGGRLIGHALPAVAPWIREAIAAAVPNASLQAISAAGRGEDLGGIAESAGEGAIIGGLFGGVGNKFFGWDAAGPAAAKTLKKRAATATTAKATTSSKAPSFNERIDALDEARAKGTPLEPAGSVPVAAPVEIPPAPAAASATPPDVIPPAPLSPTGVATPSEEELLAQVVEARALNAKLKGVPAKTVNPEAVPTPEIPPLPPDIEAVLPEFPGVKVSPEVVHQEAKIQGVEPDAAKNPAFAEFTSKIVGEKHIDKMTPDQRADLIASLRAGEAPDAVDAALASRPDLVAQHVKEEQARGIESFRQMNNTLSPHLSPAQQVRKIAYPDVQGFRTLMEHAQEAGTKGKLLEHHMEPFQELVYGNQQFFNQLPQHYRENVRGAVDAYETALSMGPANIKTEAEKGIEDRVTQMQEEGKTPIWIATKLKAWLTKVKSQELSARQSHAKAVAENLADDMQHPDLAEGGAYAGLTYASREGGFQGKTHMAQQALLSNKIIELAGPEEGEKMITAALTGKKARAGEIGVEPDELPKTHTDHNIASLIARARMEFGDDSTSILKAVKEFYPHASEADIIGHRVRRTPKKISSRAKMLIGPAIGGLGIESALQDLTSPDSEAY